MVSLGKIIKDDRYLIWLVDVIILFVVVYSFNFVEEFKLMEQDYGLLFIVKYEFFFDEELCENGFEYCKQIFFVVWLLLDGYYVVVCCGMIDVSDVLVDLNFIQWIMMLILGVVYFGFLDRVKIIFFEFFWRLLICGECLVFIGYFFGGVVVFLFVFRQVVFLICFL